MIHNSLKYFLELDSYSGPGIWFHHDQTFAFGGRGRRGGREGGGLVSRRCVVHLPPFFAQSIFRSKCFEARWNLYRWLCLSVHRMLVNSRLLLPGTFYRVINFETKPGAATGVGLWESAPPHPIVTSHLSAQPQRSAQPKKSLAHHLDIVLLIS